MLNNSDIQLSKQRPVLTADGQVTIYRYRKTGLVFFNRLRRPLVELIALELIIVGVKRARTRQKLLVVRPPAPPPRWKIRLETKFMKVQHILYPVDFSASSLVLTSDVEWLAEHFQAKVTLLNVFEVPTSWYGAPMMLTCDSFTAFAEAEKRRLAHYPLTLSSLRLGRVTVDGDAAWNIAQWAKDHEVDLIVMGTRGNGGIARSLIGSVAMKVLHEVECPVWTHSTLISADGVKKSGISKIVCSIELSKEAVPLLRFTQELANDFGAKVSLVHSVPHIQSRTAKYFDSDLRRSIKSADEEEIGRVQIEAGTNFPCCITQTSVAQDVTQVALDQTADLIVIGRGVVQEAFGTWRTHTCEIIRQAPCPVLSYAVNEHALEHAGHSMELAMVPGV